MKSFNLIDEFWLFQLWKSVIKSYIVMLRFYWQIKMKCHLLSKLIGKKFKILIKIETKKKEVHLNELVKLGFCDGRQWWVAGLSERRLAFNVSCTWRRRINGTLIVPCQFVGCGPLWIIGFSGWVLVRYISFEIKKLHIRW